MQECKCKIHGVMTPVAVLLFSLFGFDAQPAQPVTVLRAAVGPSGQLRNGDYVLDEERATFDPEKDKQVVVLFQWQGAPGAHRMVVSWKSPDGASSTTKPVEYVARDGRFGGYWPLNLSSSTAIGTWTVEAAVDGQPAGQLSFTVGAAGAAPLKPARQIMTQPQLFARISAALVVLERSTAKGRRVDPAAAVALGNGRIVTSMAAIDGSDAIVALLPDGKRQPMTSIVAMSRAHDWVVLAGGPDGGASPPTIDAASVQVGDRCFSIEAATGGSRLLVDGAITGRAGTADGGARLVANLAAGTGTPGSPVFNEFGELVGFIGGALVPGISDLSDLIQFRGELRGAPIVPIAAAAAPATGAPIAFADAWSRGDIVHALEGREHVVSGGFAKGILRSQTVRPADQRQEFSVVDKEFVVFVNWGPQARLKGTSTLRIHDESNRVVVESKPGKLDVRPGTSTVLSNWKLTVPGRPGFYRAEVLVDGAPIWRGFVRITN
jgi:hypothetical protein